jgi:hypothetical protein
MRQQRQEARTTGFESHVLCRSQQDSLFQLLVDRFMSLEVPPPFCAIFQARTTDPKSQAPGRLGVSATWRVARHCGNLKILGFIQPQFAKFDLPITKNFCLLHWTIEMDADFWWGILNERGYLENTDVDGRVISTGVLQKKYWWTGLNWSGCVQWQKAGCCGHGDEHSGSIRLGVLWQAPSAFQDRRSSANIHNYIYIYISTHIYMYICLFCYSVGISPFRQPKPKPLHSITPKHNTTLSVKLKDTKVLEVIHETSCA